MTNPGASLSVPLLDADGGIKVRKAVSRRATTPLLVASTNSDDRDDQRNLATKLIKMDINLLLEEAWKLDAKSAVDAEKLRSIRTAVAGLIEDAYGHYARIDSNSKCSLAVSDYVDFARDYFDVQEQSAREMFRIADVDHSGRIEFDELEHVLEPLFEEHATLKQLHDNGVKALNASEIVLFATTSQLFLGSSDESMRMAYLAKDLVIFVYGNFSLMCITTLLYVDYFSGFISGTVLGLVLYIVQSLIYVAYCVIFWRYFREDSWTTAGLWLYTLGYLAFTVYYCQVYWGAQEVTHTVSLLSPERMEIAGYLLFSVGSIPFFLAMVPAGKMRVMQFEYHHTNAAARGGVLFFAGSVLFLLSILGSSTWSAEQSAILVSSAYSLYVWGRVEFFSGIVSNARESAQKLAAAAKWQRLTNGVEVRNPTCMERLVHLLWGNVHE